MAESVMDWNKYLYDKEEKPLDRLADGYSNTSIFRTIAFIGDSLSSGEFETHVEGKDPGYYDLYEYSWGQYIARKNGLKAYNFSKSGMTARKYMDYFGDERALWSKEKACQAYVIALGVNDLYSLDTPIGSLEDIDKADWRNNKQTFMGDYGAIVSRYKEISPDAKFFFVTFPKNDPLHYAENDPQKIEDFQRKTEGMIKALYEMAEYFENAYVIDLNRYGPEYNDDFRERFWLHGHLNPSGYILTAQLIDSYIDYIVRKNPQDFKNAGFINTDIPY